MRRHTTRFATILAGAAFLAAAWAAGAAADDDWRITRPRDGGKRGWISISAPFTGAVTGTIVVGNRRVDVTPRTTVFVVGKGPATHRVYAPKGAMLHVTARMERGRLVASTILVTERGDPSKARPIEEGLVEAPEDAAD